MGRTGSVLVIDDEEVMREILEALLTREGYRVKVASNTTRHVGLARCVSSVVGRFRFRATGLATTYRYPYAFRPAI